MEVSETGTIDLTEAVWIAKRTRVTQITRLLECLDSLIRSDYWKIVQTEIFEPEMLTLRRAIVTEENPTELFRLQGRIQQAERKSDLGKVAMQLRSELAGIRKQLHGKEEG